MGALTQALISYPAGTVRCGCEFFHGTFRSLAVIRKTALLHKNEADWEEIPSNKIARVIEIEIETVYESISRQSFLS
jgi:hypothetical protein